MFPAPVLKAPIRTFCNGLRTNRIFGSGIAFHRRSHNRIIGELFIRWMCATFPAVHSLPPNLMVATRQQRVADEMQTKAQQARK